MNICLQLLLKTGHQQHVRNISVTEQKNKLMNIKRAIDLSKMKRNTLQITLSVLLAAATLQGTAQVLPKITTPTFKKDTCNIITYGAQADGMTLNTLAINKAIETCSKKGGGVVVVPAGLWNTGPLVLKSGVNLHLQKGAVIQFTDDFNQYPLVKGNWEGLPQMRNQSPISAEGQQNIAITGAGIIDGNGDAWRMVKKDKLTESQWKKLVASGGISTDGRTWYPSAKALKGSQLKNPGLIEAGKTSAFYDSVKDFLRPNLLVLTNCKNILLEGVIIQNSPAWCLHPLMSEHLTVRNITVKNPWYAQNGDGIDVESCKNVLIENSTFDVGDDALCMKSGRDEAGRQRGMPTENVIIRNCIVYHAHGGFVVGSEMSGGARNIHVSNCTFIGTDIGLRFKTTRGRGGVVENIYIRDIYMKDIPGEAILFDMYYMAKDPVPLTGEKREAPKVEILPVTDGTPVFKDIYVSNVVCNGAEKGIFIRGLPEMHIKNIRLENMVIQANKGIDCSEATGIAFNNIKLITKESNPVVDVLNSDNLSFNKITYKEGSDLLFRIGGDRTGKIAITNTDATKAKQKIQYEFGASANSVTVK
jgi:polygalacturonase